MLALLLFKSGVMKKIGIENKGNNAGTVIPERSENGSHSFGVTGLSNIEDVNVRGYRTPADLLELKRELPLDSCALDNVLASRKTIQSIFRQHDRKEDRRTVVICGPCSIHDTEAAQDYALRLHELGKKVEDRFMLVMRAYFEKPRTGKGWKGLINEPYLDEREAINDGLKMARKLLLFNAKLGLPSATEFVDPFVPQYISDLISWAAIGARTVRSPTQRAIASGLSMMVGFKNDINGDIQPAIDAVISARSPQWFFGLNSSGKFAIIDSRGNENTHIVLRGSENGTNFDKESVRKAQEELHANGLESRCIIDCSHGNSGKDHTKQPGVFMDIIKQIADGNTGIFGVMLESNINEGKQKVNGNVQELKYGVSITDACIDWETTYRIILEGYNMLSRSGF